MTVRLMEGLGVGSRSALWPCLATDTCANRDRIVLVLRDASRETRTDAFEFMSEVCLSAALPGSYFSDSCSLPGATTGSLPASWPGGARRALACSKRTIDASGQGWRIPCGIGLKHRGKTQAARVLRGCTEANLLPEAPDALAFRATRSQNEW